MWWGGRKIYFSNQFLIFSSIAWRGTVYLSRDTRKILSRSDSFPFLEVGGRVVAENARDIFPSIIIRI